MKKKNKVTVVGMRDKIPEDGGFMVDTTSRSPTWSKWLSPFFCGPVNLYGGNKALNVENAWQYSKVYPVFADENGEPTGKYFDWAKHGWMQPRAVRYPMGKGNVPLYSYWDGEKLPYIEARKRIYCPLYAEAVQRTEVWQRLSGMFRKHGRVTLRDFDAYLHRDLGMTYEEVLLCEDRKMGHAFVLAMLLEEDRVWERV